MEKITNFQYLHTLSDEDFAKFLCHIAQSNKFIMDDIDFILEKYKDEKPADFECMLAWLKSYI